MNLTSCNGCGVVLDKDKLKFPKENEMYDEEAGADPTKAIWQGNNFAPVVPCPVCGEYIMGN